MRSKSRSSSTLSSVTRSACTVRLAILRRRIVSKADTARSSGNATGSLRWRGRSEVWIDTPLSTRNTSPFYLPSRSQLANSTSPILHFHLKHYNRQASLPQKTTKNTVGQTVVPKTIESLQNELQSVIKNR